MTKHNGQRIVGFDLGHGETSIASTFAGAGTAPAVVDLPGASGAGGRQHVTAVNDHPERGVMVGEAAVWARGGELYLGFKGRNLNDEQVQRPIELFATKIREDLVAHGKLLNPGEIQWVFGAPSGWTSELRESYAALFRRMGFRHAEVVPESRAALLYGRDAREAGVQLKARQIDGRVLIVDLGSSTTDFTSVVGRKDRPIDQGTELGASLIDRAIRDRVLATHPQREEIGDAIQRDRSLRLRLELMCRQIKEDIFRSDPDEIAADPDTPVIRTKVFDTHQGRIRVSLELSYAELQELLDTPLRELSGRSWRQAFRDDLIAAADAMGGRPDAVLLTGGASRMNFVLEIARQRFGVDRVLVGTEPESAIARGLALAGRMNVHAAGFLKDVTALIDGNQIEALVTERLPDFADMMGAAAADGITERHIIPAFHQWRSGEIDTLDAMTVKIAHELAAELTAPDNRAISSAFATWYNELRPDLNELTRPICARWHIPASEMALPTINLSGRQWTISLTDTAAATDVLRQLGKVINVAISGVIATTLFGGGIAIIATTGPFAIIIAGVVAYYAISQGVDAAMEKAKSYPIPLRLRRLRSEATINNKLRGDAPATERQLGRELARQFEADGGPELVADITKSISAQYYALADDAKLLVS